MDEKANSQIERWLAAVPRIAEAISIISGLLVIAGYWLKIPILESFVPRHAPTRPLGALSFILAGVAFWLMGGNVTLSISRPTGRFIGRLCSAATLAVGILSLSEYVFGWNLGIDRLLFRDSLGWVLGVPPGRIPFLAAICFSALGGGLLAMDSETLRRYQPTEVLALATILGGIVGIIDFTLTPSVAVTDIPVSTSIVFFVLGCALLVARPEYLFRRLLVSRGLGGLAFRRLLPMAVLVPVMLSWLTWWGYRAGLYGTDLGVTLMVVTNIVALLAIVLWTTEPLDQADRERTQAEEALRRAVAYNRSLLEASLDPLVTIAPDGKITDVNKAAEWATGLSRQELIGTDFSDYFTEPGKAREGYQQAFREGWVQDYPLEILRRDGNVIPVLYNASVYRDKAGVVIGVFAAARDITERQRAEEALKRSVTDLARSNADLEEFAYVASHDLQEPLRMVASFTQLLAKRYHDKLDADANEFIGFAVDGARRMQTLVNDLLAYSRVGTRGDELTPTNCEEVLEGVLINLKHAIDETGAEITHDALPVVLGDATQLGQLIQNLIGNALKFHAAQPPAIHLSAQKDGSQWRFAVRDNGIGIDAQHAERIFVIFQRLHTTAEYPGTGIGLAISKKIVERHRGRIWMESQPGQGTTFYFTIPIREVKHEVGPRTSTVS